MLCSCVINCSSGHPQHADWQRNIVQLLVGCEETWAKQTSAIYIYIAWVYFFYFASQTTHAQQCFFQITSPFGHTPCHSMGQITTNVSIQFDHSMITECFQSCDYKETAYRSFFFNLSILAHVAACVWHGAPGGGNGGSCQRWWGCSPMHGINLFVMEVWKGFRVTLS